MSEVINISSKIKSVSLGAKPEKDVEEVIIPTDVKLPDDAPARMKTLRAEGKKWYLTVVYHPDTEKPFALFCKTNNPEPGVAISDAVNRLISLATEKGIQQVHINKLVDSVRESDNVDKLNRSISLLLRHGVLIKNIVRELDKMEDVFVGSFLFQIKKFLSQYIKDGEKVEGAKCTDCGSSSLIYSEGCMTCADCGGSKCG